MADGRNYDGICVGGPVPGISRVARAPRLTVPQSTPKGFVEWQYVFNDAFGVGLWVLEGWTIEQIAKELVFHYRPNFEREIKQALLERRGL